MKSIKEKAEEQAPYTREDSWNKAQKCIIAQTSFEAGANYALDTIEDFIDNMYFGSKDAEMFYKYFKGNIHKFIEQLKGNK